ncbi:MAG: SpoIIE family protein phosphatase [Opitutales bacterium]
MWWFLAGALLGGIGVWWVHLKARRENVRLDEEKQMLQQEKQIVVEFMHNLVEAMGEGVDRKELFNRIVKAATLSTGAMSAAVFQRGEDDSLRGAAMQGLFPPQKKQAKSQASAPATRARLIERIFRSESYALGEGLMGAVAESGKAILIEDAERDTRVYQHEDASLRVRSIIAAPIMFRRRVLGVLAVVNPADGMAFNQTDFSLVQSLADQAAMVIQNSDLIHLQIEKNKMDFDLTLASSIQGMLLPASFPKTRHLEIDACYQPAQKIGGDLYDILSLEDGRYGFAIADVSGKGVPASLLMTICQTNFRHYARRFDSPAEVLRALNAEIAGEIRQDMFVTMTYVIVDTEREELTFSRAGHELPLLLQKDPFNGGFNAQMLQTEGMAVGMVPPEVFDAVLVDKTVPFRPGDILVLYTDGVTEAANREGAEFSSARLADVVSSLRDRSAHGLNQGIIASVERFGGTTDLLDDLTLIAVKRL